MNALRTSQPRFHLPAVRGMIERRILVNFRCEPEVLERLLPAPFRPKLINGWGIAGICLIRLGGVAPTCLALPCGLGSENAAHRIAVEWEEADGLHEGVYIPRRDTNALLNRLVGGTIFPGIHHAADFKVMEAANRFEVEMRGRDGSTFVHVRANLADDLPTNSIFGSMAAASEFFRGGSLGWSVGRDEEELDGLELHCREWRMEPLAVELVRSNFFENPEMFPPGSAIFDSALLMRDIAHEWHGRGKLVACKEVVI